MEAHKEALSALRLEVMGQTAATDGAAKSAAGIRSRVEAEVAEAEARMRQQEINKERARERLEAATQEAEAQLKATEEEAVSAKHAATASAARLALKKDSVQLAAERLQERMERVERM